MKNKKNRYNTFISIFLSIAFFMKQLLNNKYIYIIIITILAIVFLFGHTINYLSKNFSESDMMLELKWKLIKYGDNHTEEKELNQEEVSEEKSIVKEEDKKITIGDKQIDPNNYNNLTEFITYLNTWSWIILDVDLENEDFYVNKTLEDWTKKYIKFDKNLISKLDDNNDTFTHFIVFQYVSLTTQDIL